MPRCSCSEPSVAEIWASLCTSKVSGRAPKLSWRASVAAVSRVKVPEMTASPVGMISFTRGAETTRPSSTMPNWLRDDAVEGPGVASRKATVPAPSKLTVVIHLEPRPPPGRDSRPDDAPVIISPRTSTGPSAYLAVPDWSHVTIALAGSPTRAGGGPRRDDHRRVIRSGVPSRRRYRLQVDHYRQLRRCGHGGLPRRDDAVEGPGVAAQPVRHRAGRSGGLGAAGERDHPHG